MGQKMDIFVPVDALIADKRYPEAIDMLRGLLVSAPRRSAAIKDRIAQTQLLEADNDISGQRYNEALLALSLFWAQNPERADQAQKRIRTINHVREEYNKKAKELLAFMGDANNRGDANYNKEVAKKLQDLDDLDRNNPDSKKTILSLKETSLALVNQDAMKTIMTTGRAFIDAKEYAQATKEYLKGFPLFKSEFENAGYDEMTMQAVRREAFAAEAVPEAYEAAQTELVRAVAELHTAFESGEEQKVAAALPAANLALDQLRALRDSLFAAGGKIAQSFDTIPKQDKSPVEYQYLAFLDIFIRGRPDSLGPDKKPEGEKGKAEGIGGALLTQSEELLDRLGTVAQSTVDASYAKAEGLYDSAAYAEALKAFASAAALIAPTAQILSGWALIDAKDFVPDLALLRGKIAKAGGDAARVAQLGILAAAGQRLSGLAEQSVALAAQSQAYVAGLDESVPVNEAYSAQAVYRQRMQTNQAALAAESAGRDALAEAAASAAALLGDDRPLAALAAYTTRLDSLSAAALAAEHRVVASAAVVEGDYIERELAARTASLRSAEFLIDGAVSTRPERARAGYRDPSPTSAIAALKTEEPKLKALALWISSELASLRAEGSTLAAEPPFAAAASRIDAMGKSNGQLQQDELASLVRATQKKQAAESALAAARQEMNAARARIAEAKTLIAANKAKGTKADQIKRGFVESRTSLDRSLTGVVDSANLDFVSATWDNFQGLYSRLSADIAQTKKDYVISETFRLLGEGQTYYEQALFDLAAESLGGAQELWHEDNDTDQAQVKYWQNLVRQASDTNNKREVRQSDALYYEIGSYLSEARKYYLKGDGLMKTGRRVEAAKAFEAARQNISFVTRAFPLNAEAGLLTLQILKSTDADAYKKSLPRRVQEAVALLDTDASSGYSRIADLYKMERGYPGLKALLEKAEIRVGKRRAPPTRQELANAASLVAEAERLLKTGRKDDAARAESNLNAALGYDPTNRQAFAILRDLTTLQGKSSGPTLGLADQAILDQATRSFASSAYNQARDQLSQLYSDPNKRTRDVLKLDNDLKTLGY